MINTRELFAAAPRPDVVIANGGGGASRRARVCLDREDPDTTSPFGKNVANTTIGQNVPASDLA